MAIWNCMIESRRASPGYRAMISRSVWLVWFNR